MGCCGCDESNAGWSSCGPVAVEAMDPGLTPCQQEMMKCSGCGASMDPSAGWSLAGRADWGAVCVVNPCWLEFLPAVFLGCSRSGALVGRVAWTMGCCGFGEFAAS